jgi:threonylcarbamoyladenosine tRNA methylthiotransferase MtaB
MTATENKGPTFVITTLGCKVNQCESDALARHLELHGAEQIRGGGDEGASVEASAAAGVDVCIINTCTVTHKAAMQSRQAIRQAIRRHPAARIVVTGCYAQVEPDVVAGIEGVDAVVGHGHKLEISRLIQSRKMIDGSTPERLWSPVRDMTVFAHLPVHAFGSRTRPFLRIQDGCDAFCTYCIVPHARGPSRSMPPHQVAAQLTALGAEGFREVVLTGIHLGAYGQDLSPATSLAELLSHICATGTIAQLRLSSIEPAELTGSIIATVAASQNRERGRICPHFHIPLQSGDDGILARMHRPYKGALFDERVLAIHHRLPRAAIGVDTLIGFPGESEAAFENTYRRIEALPVTYLHVFPFSPRAGTPAFHFKERVPEAVIKARCRRMRALGERKKRTFYEGLVGQKIRVLVEGGSGRGEGIKGTTPNYVPVTIDCGRSSPATNTFVNVVIREVTDDLRVIGDIEK